MNAALRIVGLFVLAGVALVAAWGAVTTTLLIPEARELSGGGWSLEFRDRGQSTRYAVDFDAAFAGGADAEGRADWKRSVAEAPELAVAEPEDRSLVCNDAEKGSASLRCRLLVYHDGGDESVIIRAVDARVELSIPEVRIVTQVRRAPFVPERLVQLFFLLLLMAPVIWLLHRSLVISQWFIASLAVVILMVLQPVFSIALLTMIGAYFVVGRRWRENRRGTGIMLGWLGFTIAALLFLKNFKALFSLSFDEFGALALLLPVGTSYFLIRLLDLQLRWHQGQLESLTLREYLAYILFPPTIVAGPIELIDGFRDKRLERIGFDDISEGCMRIALGLFKKLVIVDLLLRHALFGTGLWDSVISDPAGVGLAIVVFCALTYLYAWLDFSAYSDIAIGISRLYGYRIVENFNWPVLAPSLAEFWRRWHMSLSGWCFRNVFFPVLVATRQRAAALIVTLLAVGLWHDLSASWMTWGLYHGAGLALLATLGARLTWKVPRSVGVIATNLFVAAGFAFVSVRDYALAWQIFIGFWRELVTLPGTALGV